MLLRVVLDADDLLVVICTPYSMGATFLVDLGNRTTAAPIAPAPMAMFRGVKAGMFEVVVVVDVDGEVVKVISITRGELYRSRRASNNV